MPNFSLNFHKFLQTSPQIQDVFHINKKKY